MGWFTRGRVSIGLDVGSRYLKVVQVSHAGSAPEVSRIAVRALTEAGGGAHAGAAVVEGIVKLFRDSGLRGRQVVTGVGGHDVIVKRVELERMKPSELREVIRWEAEQHLPFDTASVELDFQILSSGDPMDVLLVAAKRNLVHGATDIVSAAGLGLEVLDVDGFALGNALIHNHPEAADGIVMVADMGWETTTVVVVEEGIPAVTRDLHFGVRALCKTVQRETGLETRALEAMIRGQRVSPDLQSVIEVAVDEMAVELERASAFLKTRPADLGLGRVYLSGGGARIPGLADALGRILSVETHVANPFEQIPVRPDACVGVELEEIAPMLLLPVGLALRSCSRSRDR
ncbi:MAG: type IV pilus assembly protein PilM [Gammaproteobacteria bacterium]|nr:type IV pilus assembly protein PilM [Gammaproteobacteria bacterium]